MTHEKSAYWFDGVACYLTDVEKSCVLAFFTIVVRCSCQSETALEPQRAIKQINRCIIISSRCDSDVIAARNVDGIDLVIVGLSDRSYY